MSDTCSPCIGKHRTAQDTYAVSIAASNVSRARANKVLQQVQCVSSNRWSVQAALTLSLMIFPSELTWVQNRQHFKDTSSVYVSNEHLTVN